MNVVAIIQARMGSTRLPGKVLRVLGHATVLAHVVRRVQSAAGIDEIIVATTPSPNDDAIVKEAERLGASVYRGSEDDVLSRYYHAARLAHADVVVRVTSDCPLLDPDVLSGMIDKFIVAQTGDRRVDYLSNTLTRTYPRGLDVEVFSFAALARAYREAGDPAEREHVTPYLYRHPEKFMVEQCIGDVDRSHLRWTLDTEEDWHFLRQVFDHLDSGNGEISTDQVVTLLAADRHLAQINAHVTQKTVGQ
ncbi:MAG TPA: glycosyltransferase family protein [Burkholderiales bacterium]